MYLEVTVLPHCFPVTFPTDFIKPLPVYEFNNFVSVCLPSCAVTTLDAEVEEYTHLFVPDVIEMGAQEGIKGERV